MIKIEQEDDSKSRQDDESENSDVDEKICNVHYSNRASIKHGNTNKGLGETEFMSK